VLSLRKPVLVFLVLMVMGCASLSGIKENYVVCSYDTAWEAALETLKNDPVTVRDRDKGLIETAWSEQPVLGRPYGAMGRNLEMDKERARLILTLTKLEDVTVVKVNEVREHYGFRGGGRLFQWTPVEPSEEATMKVMNRLNANLKKRGCTPA
jgi:hypothetical protein